MGRHRFAVTTPQRRPSADLGVVGALFPGVLLAAAVAVDVLVPTWYCPFSPPLVVVVPAIAAATVGVMGAAAYTALSALVSVLMIHFQGTMRLPGGMPMPEGMHQGLLYGQLVALVAVFGCSLVPGYLRARREQTVERLRSVSETVQQAVMLPVPARTGGLRASAAYLAAEDEARIGGDLYDVLDTPFGVRMLIGDVRGKGLMAVTSANNLLGAFRAVAPYTPTLPELARRLDGIVRRHKERAGLDQEEFITATLVSVPEGPQAQMVCCGHPGPLLVRAGDGAAAESARDRRVVAAEAARPWPPLGLGQLAAADPQVDTFTFDAGDALLLYTDGVTEARDAAGAFYPLAERVEGWAGPDGPDPAGLVDHVVRDLGDHSRGRLGDDAALLAVRRESLDTPDTTGARPPERVLAAAGGDDPLTGERRKT